MLVILDEPHMQNVYGSIIAAPVVGAIMADVLPYLNVEPQYTDKELAELEVEVPALAGQMVHDAIAQLTAKSLKYKMVGEGTTVTRQLPAAKEVCPKGSTVILYTDQTAQSGSIAVPNVLGMSAQQANRTLLNAGLNIRLAGDGVENAQSMAISQEPAPETMVEEGAVITVTFAAPD